MFYYYIKILLLYWLISPSYSLSNNDKLIENYNLKIINHYEKLSEQNNALLNNARNFCKSYKNNIKLLKNKFTNVIEIWTKVQHIRFGPIDDFNNYSRVQFWPDKRNIVTRQYLKVLKSKSNDYLDHGSLGLKSVAIQGLPALERLIYDQFAKKSKYKDFKYNCDFMISIVQNLQTIFDYTKYIWLSEKEFSQYLEKDEQLSAYFNSILSHFYEN